MKMGHTSSWPASINPTIRDLEWAAGFIEGEGSFGKSSTQIVQATQLGIEPVYRLWTIFGGYLGAQTRKNNGKKYWHWTATGARARGIMMTLFPLLSARRQGQIRSALAGT